MLAQCRRVRTTRVKPSKPSKPSRVASLLGASILLWFGVPKIAFVDGILQARGGEALHAADVACHGIGIVR